MPALIRVEPRNENLIRGATKAGFLKTDFDKASAVLGICYVILLGSLWSYGLIDPSDGWYAEPAREMLERGELLTPLLNYQPFYEKPIGIYWAVIACYKIFGVHEFAARLPSALAAVFCSLASFKILCDLNMRRVGLLSALVIIGAPLLVVVGHVCLTDMLFTSCLTVGILSLFGYLSGLRIKYWYVGYLAIALAVLVKGPAAVVLGALIMGCYSLVHARSSTGMPGFVWWQKWCQTIGKLNPITGLAIILGVNLPWYIYETISSQWAFFNEFFIRQHFARALGEVNHQRPWYYYALVLSAGFAPWYIFLLGFRDLRRQVIRRHSRRANLVKLCVFWATVVVGIFSCSGAKLDTYVLPAVPPLAILCAIGLEYIIRLRQARLLRASAGLIFLAASGCLIGIAHSRGLWADRSDLILILVPLFSLAVIPNVVVLLTKNVSRQVLVLTASYALATALGVATMLHTYDEVKSLPLRQLIAKSEQNGGSLATFMRDSPTVLFYWGKYVPNVTSAREYQDFTASSPSPHYVLTTFDVAPVALSVCPGLNTVEATKKWWLLRSD